MNSEEKVIIIAEAGVNHNGDINLAKEMIDIAADAEVDYVKFQTWVTEDIVVLDAPKAKYQLENDGVETSQYEMLKKLELSFNDFYLLKKYAEEKGVKFLSTPDDDTSLEFLTENLKLPILKVGSGEVTNISFLRKIGQKKRKVILSTGMSSLADVEKAYFTLKESGALSVSLLHCTSNYPASFDSVNLNAMNLLSKAFNTTVGYSDHTEGVEVSIAAVALGAKIIEKHFTIDKSLSGPDHKASLNPIELKQLVKQIRNIEKAISGTGTKTPHSSELEIKNIVQKGIYINKNIKRGELLTDKHLIMKRPMVYLSASDYDLVINKKVKTDLETGNALQLKTIDFE